MRKEEPRAAEALEGEAKRENCLQEKHELRSKPLL